MLAPARAIVGFAAAVAAALVLSAFGWTSLALLGVLTLLGSLLPRRSLWFFFAGYLIVLVAWPETQSLALLGPHPWGGGRFYGISNELETMLLAPALTLGLPAAPLVLLTVGWSKAGADGGGIFVFLTAYAWVLVCELRARGGVGGRASNRLLLAGGVGVVVLGLLLVAADAATGGQSHVTHGLAGGPGRLAHDLWHRSGVSWHGATGSPGRVVQCVICLTVLAWVGTRQPRMPVVDALLIALAVSLLVNDTPQDVLFWGAVAAVALRRAVYAPRPMRRFAPLLLALPLLVFAAGCSTSKPGEATTTPLPSTVVGTVPAATTAAATVPAQYQNGDPVAGKKVFLSAGCTGMPHAEGRRRDRDRRPEPRPGQAVAVAGGRARDAGRRRDAVVQGPADRPADRGRDGLCRQGVRRQPERLTLRLPDDFPRRVRVIATDFDRTLIWEDGRLHERTIAALRRARATPAFTWSS